MIQALSFAVVLALSPERPAEPLTYEPAQAVAAAVATNGRSQLVAWKADDREALFAQMIDDTLALRAPQGVLLIRSETGTILLGGAASDGDGYLVVWTDYGRVWSAAVSAEGAASAARVVGEASAAPAQVEASRVASNGGGYLVTWIDRSSRGVRVYGRMLDRSGAPVSERFAVTDFVDNVRDDKLASNGRDYLAVVDTTEAEFGEAVSRVRLVPVSAAGETGSFRRSSDPSFTSALVFDGTTYVIAWQRNVVDQNVTSAAPVDAAGRIGTARTIATGPWDPIGFSALASNGNGSIVVSARSGSGPRAVRLAPGGMPLDAEPRSLPVTDLSGSLVAGPAPDGRYFVAGLRPLAGARLPASLDAEPLLAAQPIALSPLTQSQPRVVPVGGGHVIAIRDGSRLLANGAEVASTAIRSVLASDGVRALVAWSDPTGIRGRYVDLAGTMSEPFAISNARNVVLADAVAVDGSFLVMWEQSSRLVRARVGTSETPRAFPLPTPSASTVHSQGTLARTAAGFLLVYTESVLGAQNAIRAMPFAADASQAGPLTTIAATPDSESSPDVATDGAGHLLAVWSVTPASGGAAMVHAALLAEDGSVAGTEQTLGEGATPRVGWTGSEFVVVSGGSVAAVSREGEVLQPLAPMLGSALDTTVGGRVIAYVQPGEADQVMVRTIGAVRRRAAR